MRGDFHFDVTDLMIGSIDLIEQLKFGVAPVRDVTTIWLED